ncbi:MAG: DUF2007 domain-containing protein [Burkholderia sp.]
MRFTAPDLATAHHWVNVLNSAGIGCELHNRFATGALGGLLPDQCAPEIWLDDERDTALARRILEAARSGPPAGATRWRLTPHHFIRSKKISARAPPYEHGESAIADRA